MLNRPVDLSVHIEECDVRADINSDEMRFANPLLPKAWILPWRMATNFARYRLEYMQYKDELEYRSIQKKGICVHMPGHMKTNSRIGFYVRMLVRIERFLFR